MKQLKLALALLLSLVATSALAQPYTSRYFHYDQYYDAPAPFKILATTVDGADNNVMCLAGGGSTADTRGGGICIAGNEASSTGKITVQSGNVSGSDIEFYPRGFLSWQMQSTSGTDHDLVFGYAAKNSSVASIRGEKADGADDGELLITAGGAAGATRGAYLGLYGNENAAHGKLLLGAGYDAGDGGIYFATGGLQHFSMPLSITSTATLTYGTAADSTPGLVVKSNKADAADDAYVNITAGGAFASNRGAGIQLLGDDYGGAGAGGGILFDAGIGTTAYVATSIGDSKGSSSNLKAVTCEEITIAAGAGAAGVASGTNLCASGLIIGLGARITQAPGGGATTLDVGCTGSGNLNQFVAAMSTALGTTASYPASGDGTNTIWVQKTATTMTLTTDSNVTGASLKARVCPYYLDTTAPTS